MRVPDREHGAAHFNFCAVSKFQWYPRNTLNSEQHQIMVKVGGDDSVDAVSLVLTDALDCRQQISDGRARRPAALHALPPGVTEPVVPSGNPNGIPSQSPGLRGTSYPGSSSDIHRQPQRGCGSSVPARAPDLVGRCAAAEDLVAQDFRGTPPGDDRPHRPRFDGWEH